MDKEVLLIVDDELFYARSLAVALKKEFQRRIIAPSYEEALEKLETTPIDVALLDVRLDEFDENNKDGLKILEWIRENKPEIRAFVMTSYTEMGYRDEALELGARYFFEKPIDVLEMRRILSGKE
jgi:ActR/RegA family two-component response regulator